MILLGMSLLACSTQPEGASSLRFDSSEFQGVTTQLKGVPKGAAVPLEVQRIAQEICPRLDRARFTPSETPPLGILKVEGPDLDRVVSVGAIFPDGSQGAGVPHHDAGVLEAALGCTDCRIVFAIDINEHRLACLGPGLSLELRGGELVAP